METRKQTTYRYKSIVFGYTSSPFILNFVMKHHAETFPNDKCKEILANNFYVDNLLITGNILSEMQMLQNFAVVFKVRLPWSVVPLKMCLS